MRQGFFYLLLLLVALVTPALFSQQEEPKKSPFGDYKDPFESLLPKEVDESGAAGKLSGQAELGPPDITIEGILWGTDEPQAIIDGDVYSVGDTLQGVEAKVFKIKENIVFISYGEKIYEMSTKTKGGM